MNNVFEKECFLKKIELKYLAKLSGVKIQKRIEIIK
jgi:hypothetical protein